MKLPKVLVFVGELAIDVFREWRAQRAVDKARNAALAAKRAEQSRRYQQASNAAGAVSRFCLACEARERWPSAPYTPVGRHTCGKVLH